MRVIETRHKEHADFQARIDEQNKTCTGDAEIQAVPDY